jgi:protein TonB
MRTGSRRAASDGFPSRWPASFLLSLVAHAAVFALLAGTAVVKLDLVPTTIDLAFLDASDRSAGPGDVAPVLRLAAVPPPQPEAAPPSSPPAPATPREAAATDPVPDPPEPAVHPEPVPEPKPAPKPAPKPVSREASAPRPSAPPAPQPAPSATGAGDLAAAGPSRPGGSDARSTAPAWAATARVRYEQVLFAWMNRHKQYPMLAQRRGIEGEGSVRVRIDRDGRVLERSVARSTGEQMLDQAALDMVRRANPFPAVPSEYAGETFEFVAPIQYRLR